MAEIKNIPDVAVQRIVDAYGQPNPIVSRVDAASMAIHLSQKIFRGEIYADLPADQKDDVVTALTVYITYLAAMDTALKSPMFFARAINHALHNAWRSPKTYPQRQLQNIARIVEQVGPLHPDTHPFFKEAAKKLSVDTPALRPNSLTDMLRRSSLMRGSETTLRVAFMNVTGYGYNEQRTLRSGMFDLANAIEPDERVKHINRYYMPDTGPDTSEELLFALNALLTHSRYIKPTRSSLMMINGLQNLYTIVRELSTDIPAHHLQRIFAERSIKKPNMPLWDAGILPDQSPSIAIGLTRYYLEHHKDKFSREVGLHLTEAMQYLYLTTKIWADEQSKPFGMEMSAEDNDRAITRMFGETWAELPRPSLDDVRYLYERRLKGRALGKFCDTLSSALSGPLADNFDVVVTFYTPQDLQVRKLRRDLFKSGDFASASEGDKKAYIRFLASDHQSVLLDSGFTADVINEMGRTGKIPADFAVAHGKLTVDHVIDLHCGGTNHFSNFHIMPEPSNIQKNDFLLVQTGAQSNNGTGFWVLTLRPKQIKDGIYIPVLLPKSPESGHPPPQPPHIS